MDNFDFDAWAMLAKTAPDDFEQQQGLRINERIISFCEKRKDYPSGN